MYIESVSGELYTVYALYIYILIQQKIIIKVYKSDIAPCGQI